MRHEIPTRVIKFLESKSFHRYCEDGWYACPMGEEYIKHYESEALVCNCGADEAQSLLEILRKEGWQ